MDKMEHEVFTPLLEDFLQSPLVCWVKTVSPLGSDGSHLSEFMTLVDGVYLNDIMIEINPKSSVQRPHRKVNNDPTLRIQNLSILVQQIKSCYQVSGSPKTPAPTLIYSYTLICAYISAVVGGL
ncbi:Girdin [Labeo rohita]|uniref:Girdin n=1 Tax=Labeo rohita TaxID=84645 RepID=A0ABQ8M391_LABRO|nr:Girdin [Labeo rohita]